MVEGSSCDYLQTDQTQNIKKFLANAESVFFMSERQKNIHEKELSTKLDNSFVLSSVFTKANLDHIKTLKNKYKNSKNNKWIVLGSNSWVKGLAESEQWCKDNKLEYEVVWGLEYSQFLEKLASSKGICFLPQGLDTCPRFVI